MSSDRKAGEATTVSGVSPRLRRAAAIALLANFSFHVVTGFAAVGVHYGVLYLLLQAGLPALAGSAVGFCGGALTRFAVSYWRVFSPTHSLTVAGKRFVVAIAAQAVANTGLLALLLAAGLAVWPAQIATTILLTFVNYAVYRLWVFR
ncbi:MAG TPA: GtrA family protein [Casimicrobiaceae bacterium]|jgi:putative flippase GtrA|nr:GtrA family protein [Casimicrobiaceae bacterium]